MKSIQVKTTLIFISLLFVSIQLQAQGCSDAGFCSIHSLKHSTSDSSSLDNNSFKSGLGFGGAQYQVAVISPYLEYTRKMGVLAISAKLLMGVRNGGLATTSGLSDLILTSTWSLNPNWQLAGGVKLPFNRADKTANGLPLPMAYQTSLGTTDLILGITWKHQGLAISAGWQHPLDQNSNSFLASDYPDDLLKDPYLSTNAYHRSSDVLLRVSHHSVLNKKWLWSYSLLPIYHLANDSYVNEADQRQSIEDSKGLTLNLNTYIQFPLSETSVLEFNVGAPIKARKNRPDGLSQFSVVLEYVVRF